MKRRGLLLALPALSWAQVEAEVEANTASRAALESLPGVGPALAGRLLAARPFRDWGDLIQRVGGVRRAMAQRLSAAGLRVNGAAFPASVEGAQ
jgi:competence protein ComEA